MLILVDMDEVIADFEGELKARWDQRYPEKELFPDGKRASYYVGSGEELDRWRMVQEIIHEPGFFVSLDPMKGAKEALIEMEELGHDVYILTSPGVSYPRASGEKYQWVIDNYGQHMLEKLIITPAKAMIRGDILIDDKPEIPFADEAVWEHVIYDRAYNADITDKRRMTWQNWKETLPELL